MYGLGIEDSIRPNTPYSAVSTGHIPSNVRAAPILLPEEQNMAKRGQTSGNFGTFYASQAINYARFQLS